MRLRPFLALGLLMLALPAAAQVRTAAVNAREPIEIAADSPSLSGGEQAQRPRATTPRTTYPPVSLR